MTSVSSSPNGANEPWFCTNERLRWEFFSQAQKGTAHPRADEIDKPHEANQSSILEDKISAKNRRTIKASNMKRRITRKQKNQNSKIEDSQTNTTKVQIVKNEQYAEQENIQLEEDHIMEGESLEPEPPLHDSPEDIIYSPDSEETKGSVIEDTKKSKDESNSEEESQHAEENNEKSETVRSEDDDDMDEEGEGIGARKITRRTRLRVIITPKKPQTRKSQRKTKGPKDGESEHDFKGRDIVFVDPLDDKAEFWWPAMIVPNDEIDESMDVDGKLEENLLAGKFLVRYFEDMTYSVVEHKGLKHFIPDAEPFLTFKNTCDKFSSHIGVRRALACKTKGEPNKNFRWDYWKRPSGENQETTPVPISTLSPKKRASTTGTSKGGSNKTAEVEVVVPPSRIRPGKNKSPIRRNSSSTKSKSLVTNCGNNSSQASQEGEPSEEESTVDVYIANPPKSPSLGRRRKSETENIDSQTDTAAAKNSSNNMETEKMEIDEVKKSNKNSKRRLSSLTDKSDDGEQNSNNNSRSRKVKRVSAGESMDEESMGPSPTTPDTTSTMVETMVDVPMETTETITETLTEQSNNEPLIEIMEEDNVPSATPLTSPPLTIEDLSEAAQTNIARFNFDDPTLDSETKEKLYDDAEEELRSLMKEWRALNRNLRKMEKELMSKRTRKSRNNEGLEDDDIDTDDDEGDANIHAENGVELAYSSDNENHNEDGEEHEDEEEIQVVTRSFSQKKTNEDSKTSKGKRTLKKI